jgi:hypothetical protein
VPYESDISASDAGSGSDSVPSLVISLSVQDSGYGADASSLTVSFTASDSGIGSDYWMYPSATMPVSDAGTGADIMALICSFAVSDMGSGADVWTAGFFVAVTDYAIGAEVWRVDKAFWVYDTALGIEVTYLTEGQISLDGAPLPHILNISVDEPSVLQDLPVMDALPYRRQIGKKSRSFKIQGWTDSLTTLETLREYANGQKHLLLLPRGDSMYVLISDVQTPETPANYERYDYTVTAVEAID